MDAMLEVVNVVPVPSELPPVELAYQFNVPALAEAASKTVPVPQRLPAVVPVTVGTTLTVATTALRVEVQPALIAST